MKRLAVFQHLDVEHPGVFRDFLAADGIAWDCFELDEGAAIPDLAGYDGLWVMGGPMDVWEEEQHPWLVAEKQAIRHAVTDLKLPFLGICLGHQLLAAALGGDVAKAAQAEVGLLEVEITAAGRRHPAFEGLSERVLCLQWHGAEVSRVPPGVEVLASSPRCAVQALAYGQHAVSAQFHVEVTATTVDEWAAVPAYRQSLEATLGENAVERFRNDTLTRIQDFNRDARTFYDNWMRGAKRA